MNCLPIRLLLASFLLSPFAFPSAGQPSSTALFAQYEPSEAHPFGQLNPAAPAATADYAFMVGTWACEEQRRQPGRDWQAFRSEMRAHFTLNGYGLMNHVYTPTSVSTMTYEYDPDPAHWVIVNATAPSFRHSAWTGRREGDRRIAQRETPDGRTFRLTFYDITADHFAWVGEALTPQGAWAFRQKTCTRLS